MNRSLQIQPNINIRFSVNGGLIALGVFVTLISAGMVVFNGQPITLLLWTFELGLVVALVIDMIATVFGFRHIKWPKPLAWLSTLETVETKDGRTVHGVIAHRKDFWASFKVLTLSFVLALAAWVSINPVSAAPTVPPAASPTTVTVVAPMTVTLAPTFTPTPTKTATPTPTVTPSPTATPGPLFIEDTTCYDTDDPDERYACFVYTVLAKQCYLETIADVNQGIGESRFLLEQAGFVHFWDLTSEQRRSEPRLFNQMFYLELGIEDRGEGWCHIGAEKAPGAYWFESSRFFFVRESDMAIVWAWINPLGVPIQTMP